MPAMPEAPQQPFWLLPPWNGRIGPLCTLALSCALLVVHHVGVHVPNPILLFANLVVLSAFLGGMRSGLVSVGITLLFALAYWSAPHQLFVYTPRDIKRLIVLVLTIPPLGVIVGRLREAHDRQQRQLVKQNSTLVSELRRRSTMESRQRDVEHILRHDLRTPLGGIINIPELLLEDTNLTDQQRKFLIMIAAAGRKMLNQINSSLELQKIEDGSYCPEIAPCDPAKIIRDNFSILTLCSGSEATPLTLIEPTPVTLDTDCRVLDVIAANLLRNALEASDPGAPVVVRLSEEDGQCVIRISNSQPVPEEIRPRFFEKYATAGKSGGTGLGTYSALLMTRALGGTITMETAVQEGTTITVRLPVTPAETPATSA